MKPRIVLASASPRRREILRSLGIAHRAVTPRTDEVFHPVDGAAAIAKELARRKARSVSSQGDVVVAMDTIVALGRIKLGKPANAQEAEAMLRTLSGRVHRVITGVALRYRGREMCGAEVTRVAFRTLRSQEIRWYIRSGEPYDKAGAYAIQGLAKLFVKNIHGCYFNVVGFPVSCFLSCLDRIGFSIFDFMKESV